MPELPDLVYVQAELARQLPGARVTGVRVGDPTPLRVMVPGTAESLLLGRRLESVERRGHFMRFAFDDEHRLVVNAMLAGRYALLPTGAKPQAPAALVLALAFDLGLELRYLDSKRMGKLYLGTAATEPQIPVFNDLGLDLMSNAFDLPAFSQRLHKRRDQVRNFLLDKAALASIGNAYADEILFHAGLHPKTFCHQLSPQDIARLFESVRTTLKDAVEEVQKARPPLTDKVRDFLKVRGRAGEPCPRCGTTLRSVRVGPADADFCPACQPARRSLFIDWSPKPKA